MLALRPWVIMLIIPANKLGIRMKLSSQTLPNISQGFVVFFLIILLETQSQVSKLSSVEQSKHKDFNNHDTVKPPKMFHVVE